MKAFFILTIVVSVQVSESKGLHETGVCSFRKGLEEIDLSPLAHHVFNTKTETNHGLREIIWNPCSSVSAGICSVAVCARYTHGSNNKLISLATQSSRRLVVKNDDILLQYSTIHGSQVSILLRCSEEEASVYVEEHMHQQGVNYLMTLSSRYACWRKIAPVSVANTTSNVTVPTPPTAHSVTVTSAPSDGPAIAYLLLIEVLATILILLVLLSGVFVYINYKLKQRRESTTPPAYEQLYLDDDTMLKAETYKD